MCVCRAPCEPSGAPVGCVAATDGTLQTPVQIGSTIAEPVPEPPPAATAVTLENVEAAARRLKGVITKTPLMLNLGLSRSYDATMALEVSDHKPVSAIFRSGLNLFCHFDWTRPNDATLPLSRSPSTVAY